jgi:sterol desaturase/sphingolipid hydroxylase (fatty acid hydroxylase superfamily)
MLEASSLNLPGFFQISAGAAVGLTLRYLLFAGAAWLLGYVFFKGRWFHRKIISKFPAKSDVRREFWYSAQSLMIFGVMGGAVAVASKSGWTQLYWRISDRGWGWFWASIGCAILLHDTYFYWTHRAMHHPRLFRFFHKVHHLSLNPSPWASYAFSPAEAVVQAGIFPLAVTIMPMHPLAFMVFMMWQITYNVLGHTGYEFHPTWIMRSFLRRILNTPTNHIMHHEKFRGNYGLYFNIWDRLMGTNHPEYESRFVEVTSRPKESVSNAPATNAQPVRG